LQILKLKTLESTPTVTFRN